MLWLITVIGRIADSCQLQWKADEESSADVFPVRQSSEGGACSVARLPWLGPEASANGARLTCYHHHDGRWQPSQDALLLPFIGKIKPGQLIPAGLTQWQASQDNKTTSAAEKERETVKPEKHNEPDRCIRKI